MTSKRTVQEYLRFVQKEKFPEEQRFRARKDTVDLMANVVNELLELVLDTACDNLDIPKHTDANLDNETVEIGADDVLDAIESSLGFTISTPFSLLDSIPSQQQPSEGTKFEFSPLLLEKADPIQTPTPAADEEEQEAARAKK